MIGYGANRGIVPLIAEDMFKHIEKESSKLKSFEVNVSMIEIYNEKIQDLLLSISKWTPGGLKIWESK